MKRIVAIVALVLAVVVLNGCIVIVREETVPPCIEYPPADETIEEIDAIGKLSFDSDRHSAYERIAAREGLSESSQAYLVEAVFENLSFESAKVDVLLMLIENPSFSPVGRTAILSQLDRLSFESNKRKIIEAMNEH